MFACLRPINTRSYYSKSRETQGGENKQWKNKEGFETRYYNYKLIYIFNSA